MKIQTRHLHRLARRPNPITTRAVLVYGGAAAVAAIGWMLWQQHNAAASSPATPTPAVPAAPVGVTQLVNGGVYRMTGTGSAAAIQPALAAMPWWQNLSVVDNGNGTYTATATYTGSTASIPAGTSVTKIG